MVAECACEEMTYLDIYYGCTYQVVWLPKKKLLVSVGAIRGPAWEGKAG